MKNRIIQVFFTILLTAVMLTGCNDPSFDKCPASQHGTQWITEDGSFFIDSDSEGNTTGYIELGNEKIPVDIMFEMTGYIDIVTHPTEGGYSVGLGGFFRSGFYKENSFSMSIRSESYIASPVFDPSSKVRFEKLDEERSIVFDIDEYAETPALKNAEMIFNEIYDIYSKIYEGFKIQDNSETDSFIIALELAGRGVEAQMKEVDASVDKDLLSVKCIDKTGEAYSVTFDCSNHIVID